MSWKFWYMIVSVWPKSMWESVSLSFWVKFLFDMVSKDHVSRDVVQTLSLKIGKYVYLPLIQYRATLNFMEVANRFRIHLNIFNELTIFLSIPRRTNSTLRSQNRTKSILYNSLVYPNGCETLNNNKIWHWLVSDGPQCKPHTLQSPL